MKNNIKTLDEYKQFKILGEGGQGIVRLAEHSTTGEKYAIKFINKFVLENVERLEAEFNFLVKLDHPNIVKYKGFSLEGIYKGLSGKTKKMPYLALELVTNGDFFDYIFLCDPFSERTARYYFRKQMDGVLYCNKMDIAHRDLKPMNLLMGENFEVKITDFGLAEWLTGDRKQANLRTLVGTEAYRAPEINEGKHYSGLSVDIFALGVVLFNMVLQQKPFKKAVSIDVYYNYIINKNAMYWKHIEKKSIPLSKDLKDLINGMFQYSPEKRFTPEQIINHPWYTNKDIPTQEEIEIEFNIRKLKMTSNDELFKKGEIDKIINDMKIEQKHTIIEQPTEDAKILENQQYDIFVEELDDILKKGNDVFGNSKTRKGKDSQKVDIVEEFVESIQVKDWACDLIDRADDDFKFGIFEKDFNFKPGRTFSSEVKPKEFFLVCAFVCDYLNFELNIDLDKGKITASTNVTNIGSKDNQELKTCMYFYNFDENHQIVELILKEGELITFLEFVAEFKVLTNEIINSNYKK